MTGLGEPGLWVLHPGPPSAGAGPEGDRIHRWMERRVAELTPGCQKQPPSTHTHKEAARPQSEAKA